MPAAARHHGGADGALGSRRGGSADDSRALHAHGRSHAVSRRAAGRRRAGRHPAARPEGVHLRRRVGAAVADPQGRRLFRARRGHAGCTARRRCRSRPSARCGDVDHAADTDGRAGIADIKLVDGEIRARGPQMLVGYLHPEDETAILRRRRVLPHRRSRPLGRRRVTWWSPAGPRTSSSATARTSRPRRSRTSSSATAASPRSPSSACPTSGPASVPAPSSCLPHQPGARRLAGLRELPDATTASRSSKCLSRWCIWDALPKNDAGKVLKHQIRAMLTADER